MRVSKSFRVAHLNYWFKPHIMKNSLLLLSFLTASQALLARVTTRSSLQSQHLRSSNPDFDDFNESSNPLSKGVHSVSWLPTVSTIPSKPNPSSSKPSSKPSSLSEESTKTTQTQTLPFFPLGATGHLPLTPEVLNIFEPRYRKMYSDILLSGSRRFVTSVSLPQLKNGKQIGSNFARVGSVWYLEDLKEVSELTNDRVKFVCRHFIIGRCKILKVVNEGDWITTISGQASKDYLRVEIEDLEDDEVYPEEVFESDAAELEAETERTTNSFIKLVALQHSLEEDVRFTKASVDTLKLNQGPLRSEVMKIRADSVASDKEDSDSNSNDDDGNGSGTYEQTLENFLDEDVSSIDPSIMLPRQSDAKKLEAEKFNTIWTSIKLWSSYMDQRLVARQRELQKDFQDKLLKFLTEGGNVDEGKGKGKSPPSRNFPGSKPGMIGFNDLSPELKEEVAQLQNRIGAEIEPLVLENNLTMQKLLEARRHKDRVRIFGLFIEAERKRLEARSSLKNIFK